MRATDLLDDYLARERSKPFEWSSLENGDCLLFLLGWGEVLGFRSTIAWRGTYTDEDGARAGLSRCGGEIPAITDTFGPPRMGSRPERGDVGLATIRNKSFGVICTGGMWTFRAVEGGIGFCRLPIDLSWNTRFSR